MPDSIISGEGPSHPKSTAATDLSVHFHQIFREAGRIVDAGVPDEGLEVQAYFAAQDKFIDAPVSSLEGVRLKLEVIYDLEDVDGMHAESPGWIIPRIILNLLRDLRAIAGVNGRVQ